MFDSELLTLRALPGTGRVNAEARTITGCLVMRIGPARGHGVEIDATTLAEVVRLGNDAQDGIKCRYGHPSPHVGDALGSFLGRFKNFRLDGDAARADLHLSEAADPAKVQHVLAMAAKEPDMVGLSVVVEAERKQRKNGGAPVLRVTRLHAVDVTDEPATGAGMFAAIRDWFRRPESEDTPPVLDLVRLQTQYPDLCEQIATEARMAERDRVVKLLARCKPCHFERSNEHPDTFPLAAIRDSIDYGAAVDVLVDLERKHDALMALQADTASTMVDPAPPPGLRQRPLRASIEARFFETYRRQGKPEALARQMAQAAAGTTNGA